MPPFSPLLLLLLLPAARAQSVTSVRTLPSAPVGAVVATRIAGSLVIDLSASGGGYNPTTRIWNNLATTGIISTENGDFGVLPEANNNPPGAAVRIQGVEAVEFLAGARASLMTKSAPTGSAGAAFFAPMFGSSAWSTEAYIMPLNDANGNNAEVNNER